MAFAQEGRKAIVYQLERSTDKSKFAIKVFKPAFRDAQIIDVTHRIDQYASLPGMVVCRRIVLTKSEYGDLIRQYPELEYAVLMPWVDGQTWSDILLLKYSLLIDQSLRVARSAANVLSQLEINRIAHCDISCGNVLLDMDTLNVYLVDVEDMFNLNFPPPGRYPKGSAGYQHPTSETNERGQWVLEGDRFSGAILLAEMLTWHDARIRNTVYGESYFAPTEMQDITDRYTLVLKVLEEMSPDFRRLFVQTWTSPTLADCPLMQEWVSVIDRDLVVRPIREAFKRTLQEDSDCQIAQAWEKDRAILVALPEMKAQKKRVDLAKRRCRILDELQSASSKRNDKQLWDTYQKNRNILESSNDYQKHGSKLVEAVRFRMAQHATEDLRTAIWMDDDLAIRAAYDQSLFQNTSLLNQGEQFRVGLAINRVEALNSFQTAIRSGDTEHILRTYQSHVELLKLCSGFTSADRSVVHNAQQTILYRNIQNALSNGTESEIVDAGLRAVEAGCNLRETTLDAIRIAQLQHSAHSRLRDALSGDDDQHILLAYNANLLDHARELTSDERDRVKKASERFERV